MLKGVVTCTSDFFQVKHSTVDQYIFSMGDKGCSADMHIIYLGLCVKKKVMKITTTKYRCFFPVALRRKEATDAAWPLEAAMAVAVLDVFDFILVCYFLFVFHWQVLLTEIANFLPLRIVW